MIRARLLDPRAVQVRTLTPADVAAHAARWVRGMDLDFIETSLELMPGRSVWAPTSEELVVVSPWRNRLEVGSVNAVFAVGSAEALFLAAAERSQQLGDQAIVSVEWDVTRTPRFFDRVAFDHLQTIVTYELESNADIGKPSNRWNVRPFLPHNPVELADLGELDHRSFSWLWWNSEAEFLTYGTRPGVDILLLEHDGSLVGYVGFTDYGSWCHIDRIAVDPGFQGQGIGRELMRQAAARARRARRKRIALSTQSDNMRSRRLYEGLGFHQKTETEYRVYGRYFSDVATQ